MHAAKPHPGRSEPVSEHGNLRSLGHDFLLDDSSCFPKTMTFGWPNVVGLVVGGPAGAASDTVGAS